MPTVAPPELVKTADEWEALEDYPSAVCVGIVGDLAHELRGGYHIGIAFQSATNFSVVRVDDKAPPGNWSRVYAAAIDMGLNLTDMKKCHARIKAVWLNRKTDPRAKFFNAWNGWDGNGSPGRYDFVKGTVEAASEDHKTHIHMERKRKYANDPEATRAQLSIVKGETVEQYLGEDEAMAFIENQDDFNAAFQTALQEALLDTTVQQRVAAPVFKYDPGYRAGADGKPDPKLGVWPGISDATYPQGNTNGTVGLGTAVSSLLSRLDSLTTLEQKAIADEASRDAQEAARDAAMQTVLQQVFVLAQNGQSIQLTDAQFTELKNFIGQKVAEAGQDAQEATTRQLGQIADALDAAGTALQGANDASTTLDNAGGTTQR